MAGLFSIQLYDINFFPVIYHVYYLLVLLFFLKRGFSSLLCILIFFVLCNSFFSTKKYLSKIELLMHGFVLDGSVCGYI